MDKLRDRDFRETDQDLPLDEELSEVAYKVGQLNYFEAPVSLLPSVMSTIRKKKAPWYVRFYNWAKSPRSISFTPLQLGAFATAILLCITFVSVQLLQTHQAELAQQVAGRIPVVFKVNLAGAKSVAVIGSFNQWRPQGFEMSAEGDRRGSWTLTLSLPEGRYEYAFLVDGKKVISDPRASLHQNDGFGNENAVLILGTNNGKAI